LKRIINWTLKYIADLDIPVKRGTFVEFRNGMLNISPIGRNCSREERNAFEEYDSTAKVRTTMVGLMEKEFGDLGLKFSIGGQISFDCFPIGWDKTYCLQHLDKYHKFTAIHFFGDKTYEGGNDYELFTSDRTIGHTVTSPEDTQAQLATLFGI
jgi:phosphomannomutase